MQAWEPLSRQLTFIFGLSTRQKEIAMIAREHDDVLAALKSGNREQMARTLRVHILDYSHELDYEGPVAARRIERKGARKCLHCK